jgi:hypothetical protein
MIKSINDICAKLVKSRHQDESLESSSDSVTSKAATPAPSATFTPTTTPLLPKKPQIHDVLSTSSEDDNDDASLKSWSDGQLHKLFRTSVHAAAPSIGGEVQPPPMSVARAPIQLNTRTKPPSLPNTYNVDRSHLLRTHETGAGNVRGAGDTTVRRVSGFMRFLTHDDCAVSCAPATPGASQCAHRLRRAHYHCMHVSQVKGRARTCARFRRTADASICWPAKRTFTTTCIVKLSNWRATVLHATSRPKRVRMHGVFFVQPSQPPHPRVLANNVRHTFIASAMDATMHFGPKQIWVRGVHTCAFVTKVQRNIDYCTTGMPNWRATGLRKSPRRVRAL